MTATFSRHWAPPIFDLSVGAILNVVDRVRCRVGWVEQQWLLAPRRDFLWLQAGRLVEEWEGIALFITIAVVAGEQQVAPTPREPPIARPRITINPLDRCLRSKVIDISISLFTELIAPAALEPLAIAKFVADGGICSTDERARQRRAARQGITYADQLARSNLGQE